jgi:presenilin-like A22 family membrane protease
MRKETLAMVTMGCTFISAQLLALIIVPLYPEEYRVFGEETENPLNPLIYIGIIIIFTLIILYIVKIGKERVIQYLILGAMGVAMVYVLYPIFWHIYPYWWFLELLIFDIPLITAFLISITLTTVLYKHPEWYVVNITGILVSSGICAIFGISLAILPAIILLVALAIYDAIAVYKTKHMIDLADSVTEMHLPIILVVPKDKDYSYMKQKGVKKEIEAQQEREAMFMGLGDIVIPGILVVSAFVFLDNTIRHFGVPGNFIVSISTMIGGFIGYCVLMHYVSRGKPQAGLPLLNTGVILGYLISYYAVYHDLTFGIKLWW